MLHFKNTALLAFLLTVGLSGCGCSNSSAADPAGGVVSSPEASLSNAEALMKERKLELASAMLTTLAADPAADPIVFLRLAEIHADRGDLSKSVRALREGLDRPAKEPRLALFLAKVLMKLEQNKDAQAALERARADGAADKDVCMLFGMCLGRQNDLVGAEREFQRAMDAGYDPKAVKYNLAVILTQRGEFARAKELLTEVVTLDPKWNEARRELAHVMLLSGQDAVNVNQALDILIDVKDALKEDWYVFEYIGDAWLLLGDYEASVAAYIDALRLGKNPKSVEDKYVIAKRKLNELREKQKAELEAAKPGQ